MRGSCPASDVNNPPMPSTSSKPRKSAKPPPRKRVKRTPDSYSEEHSEYAASGAEETNDIVEELDSDHLDDSPTPKKAKRNRIVKMKDTESREMRKRKRDDDAEDDQSGGGDEGKNKYKLVGTIVQAPTTGRGEYIQYNRRWM
jgi:hypothetical protein